MNDMEKAFGNEDRPSNWGFLEDMASIGRLDMVSGDAEDSASAPEEPLSDDNLDQK